MEVEAWQRRRRGRKGRRMREGWQAVDLLDNRLGPMMMGEWKGDVAVGILGGVDAC